MGERDLDGRRNGTSFLMQWAGILRVERRVHCRSCRERKHKGLLKRCKGCMGESLVYRCKKGANLALEFGSAMPFMYMSKYTM